MKTKSVDKLEDKFRKDLISAIYKSKLPLLIIGDILDQLCLNILIQLSISKADKIRILKGTYRVKMKCIKKEEQK